LLAHLKIENLALIEGLELDFAPGLNVISGETGAGKSVLVDSLAVLVGERAESAAIRAGSGGAVVEGLFRLETRELRGRVAETLGHELEELALRREILRGQRNRCFVAGRIAPAALLRELGEVLVELHGQHEHQLLLRPPVQRDLLDAFGGLETEAAELARGVQAWRAAARGLAEARHRERDRGERLRALREEVAEIAGAGIDLAREAERRAEAERLRHVEDRLALAARVLQALAEADPAALDLLRPARSDLLALARDEPSFAVASERFTAAVEELEEIAREVGRYVDALGRDPQRLGELDLRESLLLRLTRRYGTDLAGLVAREATGRDELAALESEAGRAASLEREVSEAERGLTDAARALGRGRAQAAQALTKEVKQNLRDLGIGKGEFAARFEPCAELEAGGLERVEFLIAPNPGEPAAPLRAIASGGELSRVILALKAALARVDRVPTLVFDEIDAGIGGRIAHRVAAKLAAIAARRQVIAITHLAQIAAPADLHLRVEKVVRGGRARTVAAPVAGESRIEELRRMLGGDAESESSLSYARELLESATPRGRVAAGPRPVGVAGPRPRGRAG
jgi:DNA repair protein RecN (Recombination protein N)